MLLEQLRAGFLILYVKTLFFLFLSIEQHAVLKDLIHDLDIWYKSLKLVKALTEVSLNFSDFMSGVR